MTTATTSEARRVAEGMAGLPAGASLNFYCGAPPAPSTVSHSDYTVSYYDDQSILVCARDRQPIVFDENRTYYRDTINHAARCLGIFSRERVAEMVRHNHPGESQVWIYGVLWSDTGDLIDID